MQIRTILIIISVSFCHADLRLVDMVSGLLKETAQAILGRTGDARGLRMARKINKLQPIISENRPFPCDVSKSRSPIRPTSVHQLRPGDFDIIAAMGDSLTAANGAAATKTLDIFLENRGISWSIGGQGTWRQHLTLANIIKEFNPKLIGFSKSDAFTHNRNSQFNVAEAGSMSRDMPYMATILVKRIKADRRVDLKNDWKLVTLMIGGNDFCADMCYYNDPYVATLLHKRDLIKTIDYLRDNLPRTFVNIVSPPNMDILVRFKKKSTYCEAMHILECPCIFGKARISSQKRLAKVMRRWQQVEEELCLDPRYQTKDDFAVVLQPFVANLVFPERLARNRKENETDWSYLSEDCFHFSQKGYARASNALWNNMLEPVGEKSTNWSPEFSNFKCPTREHPFVYTLKNSGSQGEKRQLT